MHTKKNFYRLLSAKHEIDRYLQSMVWYWTKKQTGTGVMYKTIDVVGYPKDDIIRLKLDSDAEIEVPINYMHEADDTEHAIMLWHSDYYDGPISGLAEYKGKKVWFKWHGTAHEPLTDLRIFNLHEMSDEAIEYEEERHQRFRDMIGHHCDYGVLAGDVNYTAESFDEYYDAPGHAVERDYTKNKIVATLDETFIDRGYPKKEVDNA